VLNKDFIEFIQLLNSNNVKYLIIGGYAVAFHGHPRYTKDIDVWIEPTEENADKLVKALTHFGFGGLGLKADDFTKMGQVVQLGHPPNRIDIINSPDGVEFTQCYESRIEFDIENVKI
jgi:hypothetical protein